MVLASDYLLKGWRVKVPGELGFVRCINARASNRLRMEHMSGTSDRAKRYCDRANECLQIIATSQTPGTGAIYLQIAEHYLLLATSEKKKTSSRTSNRSLMETVAIDTIDA